MIGNSALLAFTLFIALILFLLDRLRFLAPLRNNLFHAHGPAIALFASLLFLNLFAAVFALLRRSRLKNTGQKLLHMDKQVKTGHSALSREIAERYEE